MFDENMDERQLVDQLLAQFDARGLLVDQVIDLTGDARTDAEKLQILLEWVEEYENLGSREAMEELGFLYPPIEPEVEPDTDWYRFELWLNRQSTVFTLRSKFPEGTEFPPADQLTDEEIHERLDSIYQTAALFDIEIELMEDLPERVEYQYLITKLLDMEMDKLAQGNWVIDGCSGYCPGCLQRPWCSQGMSLAFQEDYDADHITWPDTLLSIVQPTRDSLRIVVEDLGGGLENDGIPEGDWDDDLPGIPEITDEALSQFMSDMEQSDGEGDAISGNSPSISEPPQEGNTETGETGETGETKDADHDDSPGKNGNQRGEDKPLKE